MLSTIRIASATPDIRPDPPKIETPPSSTIVITSSSKPLARSPRAVPSLEAKRIPAAPATSDDETNSAMRMRSTLMPEKAATSVLSPMT